MRTSQAGIDLIKYFEGLRLRAYKDTADVWTIGYGHTGDVNPDDVLTEEEAEFLLRKDLISRENAVERSLKTTPLQHQFDAMVSLCYNIGNGGFKTSSVVKYFNMGAFNEAGLCFLMWNKSRKNGVLQFDPILNRRRMIEQDVFTKGEYYAPRNG